MTIDEEQRDEEQRKLLPDPGWSDATEPYWKAAGKDELVIQRCDQCGFHRWPMNPVCYHCFSTEWSWAPVDGTGRVFSFTWADFPIPPDGQNRNIAVVELDGTQGAPVRVMSWVVDIPRDDLVCDLPVQVTFLPVDDEVAVPVWRPRPA
jgi:uncharacterized OB-fold protein